MTKEEYENFVLRYKGCGACFPMYHTLSRFEKMWFTAIQKDVAELEKEKYELLGIIQGKDKAITEFKQKLEQTEKKDLAELKEELEKEAKRIVVENINHAYPFITEHDLTKVVLRLLKEIKEND